MSIPYSSIAQLLQSAFPSTPPSTKFTSKSGKDSTRYCGVCGDVTKSFHFGGLCCNSCKSFFRRSIHNDNYLHFFCGHQRRCVLSLSNRKNCRYCRMNRCFAIGMDKGWLWTDEERMASIQNRSEKKPNRQTAVKSPSTTNTYVVGKLLFSYCSSSGTSICSKKDDYRPQIETMTDFLTVLEIKEIESVINKYSQAYQSVPYRDELLASLNHGYPRSGVQVMEMIGTSIRRFHHFSQLLADFSSLPFLDQNNLLKGGILEMSILRLSLIFDPINNCWPDTKLPLYINSPVLNLSDISQLTSPFLYQMNLDFIRWMQQMGVDEPTVMMLILIVLFTPERAGIIWKEGVEKCQSHYTTLMERYMKWRHGPDYYKPLFGKLLTKLSDLRELSDSYNSQNLRLGSEEIFSIQQQLHHLKINPFSNLLPVIPYPPLDIAWNGYHMHTQHQQGGIDNCNRSDCATDACHFTPNLDYYQPLNDFNPIDQQQSCYSRQEIDRIEPEDVTQVSQMIDEKVAFLQAQDYWMSSAMDVLESVDSQLSIANYSPVYEEETSDMVAPSPLTLRDLFDELDQCQFEM